MPILRRPSSSITAVEPGPPDRNVARPPAESGAFPAPRTLTARLSAVGAPRASGSAFPRANVLPSLVVPPRAPPPAAPPEGRASPRRETTPLSAVASRSDDAPRSGRMLDAVDFADFGRVAIELSALPAGRALALGRPPTPLATPTRALPPVTPVGSSDVARRPSPDPRRLGIFAFAGFGLPPRTFLGTPAYAIRVLVRKRILRAGLVVARRQRSPDVDLYEAAIRTVDGDAFAQGLLVLLVCAVVAAALAACAFAFVG